jgi:hypothetical protein
VALVVRRPNEDDRRALSAAEWAAAAAHARHLLVCVDGDRPLGVLIGEGSGLPWYFALWQAARGGWARASHAIRGSDEALPASMAMRNCSLLLDPSAGDRAGIAAALLRYVNGAS